MSIAKVKNVWLRKCLVIAAAVTLAPVITVIGAVWGVSVVWSDFGGGIRNAWTGITAKERTRGKILTKKKTL